MLERQTFVSVPFGFAQGTPVSDGQYVPFGFAQGTHLRRVRPSQMANMYPSASLRVRIGSGYALAQGTHSCRVRICAGYARLRWLSEAEAI